MAGNVGGEMNPLTGFDSGGGSTTNPRVSGGNLFQETGQHHVR